MRIKRGFRKFSIPTVLHTTSSVRSSGLDDSSKLVTSAALSRTIFLKCIFSSPEYHADASSCLDLGGIKTIVLVAENDTDLTFLERFIIGCWVTSMVEESSMVLTAWCRRDSPICLLGTGGKSTIKLLPSWCWYKKSPVAIVVHVSMSPAMCKCLVRMHSCVAGFAQLLPG